MKTPFSDKFVKALPPQDKRYEVRDPSHRGLAVRVSPVGKNTNKPAQKTFVFIYDFNGQRRRMTIGPYPEMTLANARKKWAEARVKLNEGTDPSLEALTAKQERIEAPTVTNLVDEFMLRHVEVHASRSMKEYRRNLEKDVLPAWGRRKARDITRRDVITLLEGILDRGSPNQANQIFKILRKMFNFATERDIVDFSPCLGVKMPAPLKSKTRFLLDAEIKTLFEKLDEGGATPSMRDALKLILVTGQRPGEVLGMHHDEIQIGVGEPRCMACRRCGWWTIPASRSKNKREHRVYLTPQALEIVDCRLDMGFLFPTPKGREANKPMETNAAAHAVRRNEFFGLEPWTPHDLRRTAATHLAGMGYTDEIIGAVLNHTRQGVTSIYNRHRYEREIESALTAWATKLDEILNANSN